MDALIPFLAAVVALMIVPGPDMAYAVASGISYGKRGALYSALGMGSGGLILTLLTALVLYAAQGLDQRIFVAIQIFGCLYLLYLAAIVIGPRYSGEEVIEPIQATSSQLYLRGVITNVSNPKALVFFLSFIPQFIAPGHPRPEFAALGLGLLLSIVGTAFNFGFGIAGSMANPISRIVIYGRSLAQYILSIVFIVVALFFLSNIIYHLI